MSGITEETVENVLSLIDQIVTLESPDEILQSVASIRKIAGDRPSVIIKQVYVKGTTPSVEGFYSLEDFLQALHKSMGRTYAWRTDYLKATEINPDVRTVKNEEIQKWQMTRQVPEWAYNQISKLKFSKREGKNGPAWTTEEYDFLQNKYLENPKTSNSELAYLCSQEFGRDISENSIKGSIDRLRKRDKLPRLRKI